MIHDEFKKLRNFVIYDTSLIWKRIRQLITLKYNQKRQTYTITVNEKDVTNPKNIANAFNNFLYTNIGLSLSKTITGSKYFLNNFALISFVLKPVMKNHVCIK